MATRCSSGSARRTPGTDQGSTRMKHAAYEVAMSVILVIVTVVAVLAVQLTFGSTGVPLQALDEGEPADPAPAQTGTPALAPANADTAGAWQILVPDQYGPSGSIC